MIGSPCYYNRWLIPLLLTGITLALGQTPNPSNAQLKELGDVGQTVFEANQGQENSAVKFLMRSAELSVFLTPQETILATDTNARVRLSLAGSWVSDVEGVDPLQAKVNYFLGNDPSRWLHNIPSFSKVRYPSVYPGVALEYRINGGQLTAEFQLSPNADVAALRLQFQGAGKLEISPAGELVLNPGPSEIRILPPQVFESSGAGRRTIEG